MSDLPPPVQPVIASPRCTQCGQPTVWYPQYSRWACEQCRLYLDPQVLSNAPANPHIIPPPPKPDAAKRVLSIIGTIVFIIIIAAVKIGCRTMLR